MSWEEISAIASVVTTAVIAVTAIVAVVQIRHLRAANQLDAALTLYRETDELAPIRSYVAMELERKMQDPAYRQELTSGKFDRSIHLEIQLGNYWEKFGILLRNGLLDKHLFLDWGAQSCLREWKLLREVTRSIRVHSPEVWRDFEFLAHLSAAHLDRLYARPMRFPKWREGLEEMDVRGESASS